MIGNHKEILGRILRAGLDAVDPEAAVLNCVRREGSTVSVGDRDYDLDRYKRILLIGAGKGTAPMAKAVEQILGDHLTNGWIIVK